MKSSQSALEPLELEPLELRLLPELELSLPTTPGDVVSAAAERSARAMKRSLAPHGVLMASMQVRGFSFRMRPTLLDQLAEYHSYDPEEWSSNRTGGGKCSSELQGLPST